jgi:putative SOS response-associated peptidase YedK
MCGRYLIPDEADVEREWNARPGAIQYFQTFNFAPTQNGPVLIEREGARAVELMTWGFQPFWAKRAWINARAETVLENRAFAPAAKRQRCLVIASGWYEWTGTKAPKQPFLFKRTAAHSLSPVPGLRALSTIRK